MYFIFIHRYFPVVQLSKVPKNLQNFLKLLTNFFSVPQGIKSLKIIHSIYHYKTCSLQLVENPSKIMLISSKIATQYRDNI